ncbi:MAG: formate dehydrogenase subunit alpha [Candidatus Accumulibacter meliphilus]|jgi:formate dehydrogenase major subunit|uniref:formate dehydrogenase subunit alpha n=1 Tax=Candidatus Accumulibacter meliphilus TaxID=2211374 RepID=UPI002FC34A86
MSKGTTQATPVGFVLDGRQLTALPGETIWQAARRAGTTIPHLCTREAPDYRPGGNCRACMVEIDGERNLVPSCTRQVSAGMQVRSDTSERALNSRRLVIELLLTEQPSRAQAHDRNAPFWHWTEQLGLQDSRFPPRAAMAGAAPAPLPDRSHAAMTVQLDACIHCQLCVQACRDIQANDVIGMAGRGAAAKIVFDLDDVMGDSSCVGCGECVQACPTGALMATTMLTADGSGLLTTGESVDRVVPSICPYCGVGCQIDYQVRKEQIVAVTGRNGPANRERLCVKGRFGFDYVHSPQRLLTPLIRRDDAPKIADAAFDPANPLTHFREASWDEALERAAAGLRSLRQQHGGKALAGFGSAKCSNEEAYLFQKLVRTGFGTNNVDHCTRLCHASSVAALIEGVGSGAVSASFMQIDKAEVAILIGCNPEANHPVASTFFKRAARRGTRLIVIDPRRHGLARFADQTLQFRPGSDVALLNAMLHTIVDEALFDPAYIARYTSGFDAMRAHLAAYSPEAMAEVCAITAGTIREVARLYARSKASMIFWGMGISQHAHGTDNARCLIAMALMSGHIGRPGTGLHPLRGQNNVQGASDAGLIPMVLPDYLPISLAANRHRFEQLWNTTLDPQPGLTVVEIMNAAAAGDIRGMYIVGENPAMSDPDLKHARQALASLEHLVVQDLFLTETAIYADVILPASAWPEKEGTVTNTNRQVQLGRQALPLPGDTQPDWWIIQELARRLDLDWHYEGPAAIYAEMRQAMPSLANISRERLQREGSVSYPCAGEDLPGADVVFANGFPTPSGRAGFVAAALLPPDELPSEDYPLVLSTGRLLEHWHTGAMSRRSAALNALEPEAVVTVSDQDLRRLGLADGERVRLITRRGAIEATAHADPAVAPGLLWLPFCFHEAAANRLTNPMLDPFGKIPEFKYCAVRLERAGMS